jgi:uncharacterized protein YcbX
MEISEINIYPIKSLGGISLNESLVEEQGLRYDRRWMLVDGKGKFFTQREFPKMATLKVSLENDGLRVSDQDDTVFIPFDKNEGQEIPVEVWNSKLTAQTSADHINQWFSDALQTNCRLVQMNQNSNRPVNPVYAVSKQDKVSFADGYPVLLIGESSLGDLNQKLFDPLPMNRFRPNLVVKNSEAFAEDSWRKIKVGNSIFYIVKPCARCVMTTIDQKKGVFDGKEPLKTLSTYRLVKKDGESSVLFGQNLIAESAGETIKIGDQVEILEIKE